MGFLKATIAYRLKNPKLKDELTKYIKGLNL
jgi:hypothetical protein